MNLIFRTLYIVLTEPDDMLSAYCTFHAQTIVSVRLSYLPTHTPRTSLPKVTPEGHTGGAYWPRYMPLFVCPLVTFSVTTDANTLRSSEQLQRIPQRGQTIRVHSPRFSSWRHSDKQTTQP